MGLEFDAYSERKYNGEKIFGSTDIVSHKTKSPASCLLILPQITAQVMSVNVAIIYG